MTEDKHKTLVVDGMGGDNFPKSKAYERIGTAIKQFYDKHPQTTTRVIVTGDSTILIPYFSRLGMPSLVRVEDVKKVLPMDFNPLDRKDDRYKIYANDGNTIRTAYEIAKGDNNACVMSIGNTIGLVHYAAEVFGTMPSAKTPCLVGKIPCRRGIFYGVDLGANPKPRAIDLFVSAVATEAFVRHIAQSKRGTKDEYKWKKFMSPRVGLLSYGTEDIKLLSRLKQAKVILNNWSSNVKPDFDFLGHNVEPKHLFKGEVELAVGPGDYENLVIKTVEAAIPMAFDEFKDHCKKTLRGIIGGLLLKERARSFKKERMSPEIYSGALLLLVYGYAVKAHGDANIESVLTALEIGEECAGSGALEATEEALKDIDLEDHCQKILAESRARRTGKIWIGE